jgi:pyruvate dehydrogenase E1 component alpha subunit/2-oxoisovalerate dehydrogenase E1 component alpha subunit
MVSHLGAMISVVNGALFARRMKGVQGTVGGACIGDGGTSTGAFHEAVNQAAVERLPLVLVVANNHYAYSTGNERQFACQSLVDRAAGYGVASASVDGTDLMQCLMVVSEAVNRARSGLGPQLVFADLLRLCGHGEHDDGSYVDKTLKASPCGRDCLVFAQEHLLHTGLATHTDLHQWRNEATDSVEEAVAKVQREPGPDPYTEDWEALASKHLTEGGVSAA